MPTNDDTEARARKFVVENSDEFFAALTKADNPFRLPDLLLRFAKQEVREFIEKVRAKTQELEAKGVKAISIPGENILEPVTPRQRRRNERYVEL